jgi:hypothetical protein
VFIHPALQRTDDRSMQSRPFVTASDNLVTSRNKFFTYFIRSFRLRLSSRQCCSDMRRGGIDRQTAVVSAQRSATDRDAQLKSRTAIRSSAFGITKGEFECTELCTV